MRRFWSARADSGQRRVCNSQSAAGMPECDTLDVGLAKGPTRSPLSCSSRGEWKLGGFYARLSQVAGHDGNWFAERAPRGQSQKPKSQCLVLLRTGPRTPRPCPFMATATTDKLYDEMQTVQARRFASMDLTAGAKTFKLTDLFPVPVAQGF